VRKQTEEDNRPFPEFGRSRYRIPTGKGMRLRRSVDGAVPVYQRCLGGTRIGLSV